MIDKQSLLKYWASELLAVKMELEKFSFLLNAGVKPTSELQGKLDKLLDRKILLEKLIDEIRNQR